MKKNLENLQTELLEIRKGVLHTGEANLDVLLKALKEFENLDKELSKLNVELKKLRQQATAEITSTVSAPRPGRHS